MKTLLLILCIAFVGCKKEQETPKCFTCTTKTTKYTYGPNVSNVPKESTGTPFESCTDVSGEKRSEGTNWATVIKTTCISK